MTGKDFKIKLIKLNITQEKFAEVIGVSTKTINNVCNATTVSLVYQWALYGYELSLNNKSN